MDRTLETESSELTRLGALALLVVMGTMWGLQFAMLKLAATGGHSELNVLMMALVLLSVAFVAIVIVRGQLFAFTPSRIRFFIITSVLGYVLPLAAAIYAAAHVSAGVLTFIASIAPVATISIALLLRTEYISPARIVAVGFGLVSILLVLWPELSAPGLGRAYWMAIALIVPLCYAMESIYVARYWPRGLSALQAVTGETLVAMLVVAPLFLIYGDPIAVVDTWGNAELAIAIFVAAGVVESLIYFYLIQQTGGVFVSFGTFVSLFAGIGWGIVLFSEAHAPAVWLAVLALVVALVFVCRDRPRRVD